MKRVITLAIFTITIAIMSLPANAANDNTDLQPKPVLVKIFSSASYGRDIDETTGLISTENLQKKIDLWMKNNKGIKIIQTLLSTATWGGTVYYITITIVYTK